MRAPPPIQRDPWLQSARLTNNASFIIDDFAELDDKPTKRETKKKGTTRQRLNKIVNKRTGGREARE